MGLGGLITGGLGLANGGPKAKLPNSRQVTKDYLGLLQGFSQGQPTIYDTEAKWAPKYLDLAMGQLGRSVPAFTNIMQGSMPAATDMVRSLRDPNTMRLQESLTGAAQSGLDAGASIDPELMRIFQQSVRGGQADRGLGNGPSDVLQESLGLTGMGNQLRQQRQGFAQGVTGMDLGQQNQESGDIMNLLLGITSGGSKLAQSSGPTLMPSNQTYDMFNTGYNARAAAGITDANTQAAMIQGFNSVD